MTGQPDLQITHETGNKNGTYDLVIEQKQDYLFAFSIDFSVKDSKGIRTLNIPVKDKITRIIIKADQEPEVIPDPDIKLLFRIIND